MQALVEQCVGGGRAEPVERCVLAMDLLSLDLNQASGRAWPAAGWSASLMAHPPILAPSPTMPFPSRTGLDTLQLIPLCIRHRLWAALVHIFARALQDHQTPAALLLVAAAAAGEAEAAAGSAAAGGEQDAEAAAGGAAELLQRREGLRLGYRLLLFLRCCLRGASYPPGARHACPPACDAVTREAASGVCVTVWGPATQPTLSPEPRLSPHGAHPRPTPRRLAARAPGAAAAGARAGAGVPAVRHRAVG